MIKEFTDFYRAEIYNLENSKLIFDDESDVVESINDYKFVVDGEVLSQYHFVDSAS